MERIPRKAPDSYDDLLARFTEWARNEDTVRALMILGSRAREDHPADRWADLDLLLVVRDPLKVLSETEWLDSISPRLLTFVEPTAVAGQSERRVLFEGMYDVDLSVVPVHVMSLLANEPPRELLFNVFGRGHRLVLDKDGMQGMLSSVLSAIDLRPVGASPSQEEYLQVVNDFLYHVVWTAKHLERGELFWAKRSLDCHLTPLLLQMLEWHARALHGQGYDTWFRGRFLEEWADPRATASLKEASARYDEAELKKGLHSLLGLFQWVATETSERTDLPYPQNTSQRIADWLEAA
jgi:aminoglycoside 6-adenylyltransferase